MPTTAALELPAGVFVTLRKEGRLRGCIGRLVATEPLRRTVAEVAVSSAFEDPRFPPVRLSETDTLQIEISILSPLRRIMDTAEIEPGVHGVLLQRGSRSGLLLPQVATEQGWGRDEFLEHTCRKAGLPAGSWRDPDTRVEIFSAFVFGEGEG